MFPETDKPRVYYLPPGVDFPKAVVAGLSERLPSALPHDWAKVQMIANSGRMIMRLREVFDQGPARLLPQMSLVTDIEAFAEGRLPPAPERPSDLRRTLDLAKLLRQPGVLATPSAALDHARSLLALLQEMEEEGVGLSDLERAELGNQSEHWARALAVLKIASSFTESELAGQNGRSRTIDLIESWRDKPPGHPIIAVGSTGSRGATQLLLAAISSLPQGAVILPGFDPNTPEKVRNALRKEPQEDHPQYRYVAMLDALGLSPDTIEPWIDHAPPSPARNAVASLALRPAPATHHWLQEGPALPFLPDAMTGVTLLEARDQRQEATAIALRLRAAAEDGAQAALISPDRNLTRRVAAALDRWDIVPDDSAGIPLSLTAPGRLLGQLGSLAAKGVSADNLIGLLKHPLVATGNAERGPHLLRTRALEMRLRRKGPPYPSSDDVLAWAQEDKERAAWGRWLAELIELPTITDLSTFCHWLRITAEALSAGAGTIGSGALWEEAPGRAAEALLAMFETESETKDALSPSECLAALQQAMAATPMNIQNVTHPNIMIWGTLDARAQGADMVILGGLNDGVWPQETAPDPWMNRLMRAQVGLRCPERQIGLSAHDFQQAFGAPEVWLTRALKSDDAETVPSRWLNRLVTLMEGLEQRNGPEALQEMRGRAAKTLDQASRLDAAHRVPNAARPSPRPPVAARPRRLTVTEIKTLIRDPYAIYAKHVLRLRELDPLVAEPDALLRGTVLHKVMEAVFAQPWHKDPQDAMKVIEAAADRVLAREVPWLAARTMWKARLMRVAPWFIQTEERRQRSGKFAKAEVTGAVSLDVPEFTLAGTADRIDRTEDDRAVIYDYKTGKPPGRKEQTYFDKQLLLEASMLERGGFADIAAGSVARAAYIGLGSDPEEADAPLGESDVWADFTALISRMLDPEHGFTSRRAMQSEADDGRYDHLARFGEWSAADDPTEIDL